jgi:hypothetical protein
MSVGMQFGLFIGCVTLSFCLIALLAAGARPARVAVRQQERGR